MEKSDSLNSVFVAAHLAVLIRVRFDGCKHQKLNLTLKGFELTKFSFQEGRSHGVHQEVRTRSKAYDPLLLLILLCCRNGKNARKDQRTEKHLMPTNQRRLTSVVRMKLNENHSSSVPLLLFQLTFG